MVSEHYHKPTKLPAWSPNITANLSGQEEIKKAKMLIFSHKSAANIGSYDIKLYFKVEKSILLPERMQSQHVGGSENLLFKDRWPETC